MRVLILSTWWPEPADNGSRLRAMHLIRSLAREYEVHLIAFTQGPVEDVQRRELDRLCASTHAIRRPDWNPGRLARVVGLLHPEPSYYRASWSQPFAQTVNALAAQVKPDVVVAFEIDVAGYARCAPGIPAILEEIELASLFEQFSKQPPGPHRLRYWLTWAKHARYVKGLINSFAACTVVSAREERLVRYLVGPHQKVEVVPNGADVASCAGYRYRPDPNTLIYPGALSYSANLDAMRFFLSDVFPLIRQVRPETVLRITGRSTAEQRAALPSVAGVELTGYVEDVRGLIARSSVEVAPLTEGGGTRLKILEALALGVPVVSTSKGMEGLDLTSGRELLVANNPAAFAAATLRLLDQPELRRRLGEAGRRAVTERYDWAVITPRFNRLVEQIAGSVTYERATA